MEKKYIPPLTLLLISVIVTASVAVTLITLFTQTFPPVPTFGALVPNCESLFNFPRNVSSGSTGFVLFRCGDETTFKPAFNQTATAALNFIPVFELPPPYDDLGIVIQSAAALPTSPTFTCTSIGNVRLANGTAASIGGGLRGFYCAHFTRAPVMPATLPSFNINWTQASA